MDLSSTGQASYDIQQPRLSQAAESLARQARASRSSDTANPAAATPSVESRNNNPRQATPDAGAAPGATFQDLLGRASSGQVREGELQKYFPGLFAEREGQVSSGRINALSREQILAETQADPEKERLYDAAKDFQTLFVKQMLSAMRKNLDPESDLLYGGFRQRIYEDMLYDEYAKQWSEQGDFDLADQIYRQMSPQLDGRSAAAAAQSAAAQNGARAALDYENNSNRISTSERFNPDDWQP